MIHKIIRLPARKLHCTLLIQRVSVLFIHLNYLGDLLTVFWSYFRPGPTPDHLNQNLWSRSKVEVYSKSFPGESVGQPRWKPLKNKLLKKGKVTVLSPLNIKTCHTFLQNGVCQTLHVRITWGDFKEPDGHFVPYSN